MWPFNKLRIGAAALGRKGERRAAWFYRLRGWRIVGRNVRTRGAEVDLVVRRGKTIALVEVKTRSSADLGEGWEAVDRTKRQRLVRMGDRYAAESPPGTMLRYDIVSLLWTGRRFVLTHFPDAFRPEMDPMRPWRWKV